MSPRLLTRSDAFSLVEIVLAIGIISFAIVGIIGLFPVALDSATASQRETHAALIARTVFNDLTSRPGDKTALIRERSLDDKGAKIAVDLSKDDQYYLAFDAAGLALPEKITSSIYEDGAGKSDAVFLVKVTVAKPTPDPAATTPALPDGLSRVDVTVTAPAPATLANRSRFNFASLLRQK